MGKKPADYQFDDETNKKLNEMLTTARKAGKKIGLPDNFLDDLMDELRKKDDWPFIIKSHALIETILNHILADQLTLKGAPFAHKQDEMSDFITRLPINGRNGKAEFAKKLGLISDGMSKLTARLSEIRNFYVHDLRNIGVSVEEYVFGKHKERKHEFYRAFFPNYDSNKEFAHSLPNSAIAFRSPITTNRIVLSHEYNHTPF